MAAKRAYRRVTRQQKEDFLAALAELPNVTHACRVAGINRKSAYSHKIANPDFAAAWEEALDTGIGRLEEPAMERGIQSSDRLLMFLLKAYRPERYRDAGKVGVAAGGEPVKVVLRFPDALEGEDRGEDG